MLHLKNHTIHNQPQDSFTHRLTSDPYLDWMIMMTITGVLTGVVIGLGIISYYSTQATLNAPATNTVNTPALFDTGAMNATLKTFESRAEEQAALLKGYGGVADPSL